MPIARSAMAGVRWPPLPEPAAALALAIQFQLARSERWGIGTLLDWQFRQITELIGHAFDASDFWRARLRVAGYRPGMPVGHAWFADLPVLTRREIQRQGEQPVAVHAPASHGLTYHGGTSGSTGVPIRCTGTDVTALFWRAFTLREHLWHRYDLSGRLLTIRAGVRAGRYPTWGEGIDLAFDTGAATAIEAGTDSRALHGAVCAEDPDYLLTYPSVLRDLARMTLAGGDRPARLRAVRTFGETVDDDLRAEVHEAWGVPLIDTYSASEVGYIAIQCPQAEHLHVQAEGVLVEVLDERGRPCREGEIGRVVLTDLHNFATPIIRYEIGDYAEVGGACACGRGLPVLGRVVGRSRNMLRLADGRRLWPRVGGRDWRRIAPVIQGRLVQKTLDDVVFEVVTERRLTADERDALARMVQGRWGESVPVRVQVTEVAAIERRAGFKFEEFVSEVAD